MAALSVPDAAVRFGRIALEGSEAEQKPTHAHATHLSESLEQCTSDNFWAKDGEKQAGSHLDLGLRNSSACSRAVI